MPRDAHGRFKQGHDANRHHFTQEERRRGGQNSNGKPFATGHDARRHRFTAEECSEAGRKGFAVTMARGLAAGPIKAKIYAHYGKNHNGHRLATPQARAQSRRMKRESRQKLKEVFDESATK